MHTACSSIEEKGNLKTAIFFFNLHFKLPGFSAALSGDSQLSDEDLAPECFGGTLFVRGFLRDTPAKDIRVFIRFNLSKPWSGM